MELRLSSIEQAPGALPVWQSILDDLGNPPAARVARTLGVGVRTVYRWNSDGHAPRVACLALFWLTTWGRSQVDAQAVNDARLAVSLVRALDDECVRLRAELRHVLALGDTGAANGPSMGLLP